MTLFSRFPLFPSRFDPETDFLFTGEYVVEEKLIDNVGYWLFTLTSNGILTPKKTVAADMCLCGGGAGGQYAQNFSGGSGGSGGFVTNVFNIEIPRGEVIIGLGGDPGEAGTATTIGAYSAAGGTLTRGGSGGGAGGGNIAGYGQDTTTRPFGSASLDPLGAGGGGGGYFYDYYNESLDGGIGGTDGGNGSKGAASSLYYFPVGGVGGNKGGGKGYGREDPATAGTYYGAGGGGGLRFVWDTSARYKGGAGYQGVIMIRVRKEG